MEPARAFDVHDVSRRLLAQGGGYEIVHESPGLEIGVYALVAPEPDRQQPHEDDEIYVVLDGTACSRWRTAQPSSPRATACSFRRAPNIALRATAG